MIVYSMMRNQVNVASVITLDNGKCIVAWPTSTALYDSEEAAHAVHIDHMGGRGERTYFAFVWASHPNIKRGWDDCYMDSCENAPFGSTGGPDERDRMTTPRYINDSFDEYLAGYRSMARTLYGTDWRTCEFSWKPALEIHPAK